MAGYGLLLSPAAPALVWPPATFWACQLPPAPSCSYCSSCYDLVLGTVSFLGPGCTWNEIAINKMSMIVLFSSSPCSQSWLDHSPACPSASLQSVEAKCREMLVRGSLLQLSQVGQTV